MIVARCNDPMLRRVLRVAAPVEEDVVTEPEMVAEALQWGFARMLVRDHGFNPTGARVSLLDLDEATLRRWEHERRSEEVPLSRMDFLSRRLRALVARTAADATWV